jgi:hypothetical protein
MAAAQNCNGNLTRPGFDPITPRVKEQHAATEETRIMLSLIYNTLKNMLRADNQHS